MIGTGRTGWLPPCWLLLVLLATCVSQSAGDVAPPGRVTELIRQLGSPEFSARERAEAALRGLGLDAYPALAEASHHDDLEIRLRARAILVDLREQHLLSDVDPAVARLMQNYSTLPLAARRERVERLISLLPQQGIELVARLTQFEEDRTLSESAVAALLGCRLPDAPDRQRELAAPVLDQLPDTTPASAQWLRAWALMIQSPEEAVPAWQSILEAGKQPPADATPRDPAHEFAIRRCYLDTLTRTSRREEAAAWIDETAAWVRNHADFHLDWLTWLVDHGQPRAVIAFQERYPDAVAADPRLRYLVAEATEQIDAPAAPARFQEAFDAGGAMAVGPLTAVWLDQERGRFDWAEREYRRILEQAEMTSAEHLSYRFILAEMLHDVGRDGDAADVLDELLKAAKESEEIQQALAILSRDMRSYAARCHLFRALHARTQGDEAACVRELDLGLGQDPSEIDLLITRYRTVAPTPAFREQTQRAIAAARQSHEQLIKALRAQLARNRSETGLSDQDLAQALNDYAWLVGNTEGDQAHALDCSRESLLLDPGTSAFLDTLGRCYFAVGDLPQAIRSQRLAVERARHEQQIRRQLAFFEKTLAERKQQP